MLRPHATKFAQWEPVAVCFDSSSSDLLCILVVLLGAGNCAHECVRRDFWTRITSGRVCMVVRLVFRRAGEKAAARGLAVRVDLGQRPS